MEGETSSNPTEGTSVDQIADLLNEKDETTQDDVSEEALTDESTDVEESNENEESDAEEQPGEQASDEEDSADEELTWESALGVDDGQLSYDEEGNVTGVNVKLDGKQQTVNVKDLIAGYQINKVNTAKAQELSEQRKVFESEQAQVAQDYKTKLDNVSALSEILGKRLVGEYEGVNWEQLRVENPAEYAAMKQDYASRAQEIQQAQQAIADEQQMQSQQQLQSQQQMMQQHLQAERDKMISNNPSWSDENVRKEQMSKLRDSSIKHYGFEANDFNNITDSRLVEVLKDAIAFRDGKNAVQNQLKKKPVPKFQKSTNKATKRVTKLDKLTKRAQSAKGSAKKHAQTDAIAELLSG